MYRVLVSFAFLVFCSAAPYGGYGGGDLSSARSLPMRQDQQIVQQPQQQQMTFVNTQQQQQQPQQDDSELVDTLGAGYSFFRKQPISSRPLIQQKFVSEQQAPMTSLDDTSNQWADYTRSSALTQQPIQKPTMTASNDFLAVGGYGQQQSAPRSAMNIISTSVQDNLQQPILSSVSGGYGSQQDDTNIRMNVLPKTLVRQDQSAYGSALNQGQQQDLSWSPSQQQQPLTRTFGISSGYGQQQQQQQQQPLIRSFGGYGQQQQDVRSIISQSPVMRNFGGYGQQQQLDQPMVSTNTNSGYGQQVQSASNDLSQVDWTQQMQQSVIQPTLRTLNSGYGQQQQQPQQLDQPTISVGTSSGYGQQVQQPFIQPALRTLSSGYGQQQQQQPQQLDQPTISVGTSSGYGQQVQQPFIQPTLRTLSSGYGQQQQQQPQQLDQPAVSVGTSSGYGQQAQPSFGDLTRQVGYGQQVQQPVIQPTLRTLSSGYGQQQQQPDLSSVQSMNDLSQSSSAFMPSSRMAFQSQPAPQMLGQRAFSGY